MVAIDAPLLVTNEHGPRLAEMELNELFQPFEAHARPAFKAQPLFDPPRGAILARTLALDIDPRSSATRRAIEVYPHPATVALFRLGRTLKYKKGAVPERKRQMIALLDHVEDLADNTPALVVAGHESWSALGRFVDDSTQLVQLDRAEDQVDAVLCAYIAMFFHCRPGEVEIFGNYPENGYIVTPALPPDLQADRRRVERKQATSSAHLTNSSGVAAVGPDVVVDDALTASPTCPCGCDQPTRKRGTFVPGHDAKALHARIAQQWGNTIGFIEWFDKTYGFHRSQ